MPSAVLAHSLLVEGEKTTEAVDPHLSERGQSDELSRTGIPQLKGCLSPAQGDGEGPLLSGADLGSG